MSEIMIKDRAKMSKEEAKQELERLKEISKRFLEQNNFREFKNIVTDKSERIMIGKECFYLSHKVQQALDIAIDSLDNEWVSVNDRLPEDRERVLVSDDTMFVTDCNYTDDLYELDNNDFAKYKGKNKRGFYYYIKDIGFLEFDSVLAWKPLPEPYERKE